ncbi:glycine-rich RNA-binding protein 2 [Solenopsis invicta]|uniref:glycine-rich RNA-binding protein 2 n=1 Tax=Solenopsis invicta TaxID=13686 RepID=UPI0005958E6F|nr:glycine-rich RNA-binding protein 2 [Solenopsis invicta]
MESVSDMLRPLHFVFFFGAFAFLTFVAAVENGEAPVQSEIEPQPDANANDLEADATYWGYGRPYRYYGGWGGGYGGRGYGGWGGWGGWNGWRGYWGGRNGWGGWGGRGYGGWGLGYWG